MSNDGEYSTHLELIDALEEKYPEAERQIIYDTLGAMCLGVFPDETILSHIEAGTVKDDFGEATVIACREAFEYAKAHPDVLSSMDKMLEMMRIIG